MRFAIVGAGAIGAYVGAALVRGGSDVTLIARGEHLRAMQENGVQVLSPRGDFVAQPAATDDFDAIGDADVVFIGLKAYSLPELAPRIGARAQARRRGDRSAERHPLVVLPVAIRARSRARSSSRVDPGGVIAGVDPARRGDRLRHLLLDRDRRARRDPPHRGNAVRDRRARRRCERE